MKSKYKNMMTSQVDNELKRKGLYSTYGNYSRNTKIKKLEERERKKEDV